MRYWRYADMDKLGNPVEVEVSDMDIMKIYWKRWKERMIKNGYQDRISKEHCIDDFVTIHWAWEKV